MRIEIVQPETLDTVLWYLQVMSVTLVIQAIFTVFIAAFVFAIAVRFNK